MTLLYKLTSRSGYTYNMTKWGEGVEHVASGNGLLCSKAWLHAYTDPHLAVMFNPIHGDFYRYLLWEADGDVGIEDHGLKVGCTRLKTIRVIAKPVITQTQRIAFAILCAKSLPDISDTFLNWADDWLSGRNRSRKYADSILNAVPYYIMTYLHSVVARNKDIIWSVAAVAESACSLSNESLDLHALVGEAMTYGDKNEKR